jgi:hypothetical protein
MTTPGAVGAHVALTDRPLGPTDTYPHDVVFEYADRRRFWSSLAIFKIFSLALILGVLGVTFTEMTGYNTIVQTAFIVVTTGLALLFAALHLLFLVLYQYFAKVESVPKHLSHRHLWTLNADWAVMFVAFLLAETFFFIWYRRYSVPLFAALNLSALTTTPVWWVWLLSCMFCTLVMLRATKAALRAYIAIFYVDIERPISVYPPQAVRASVEATLPQGVEAVYLVGQQR